MNSPGTSSEEVWAEIPTQHCPTYTYIHFETRGDLYLHQYSSQVTSCGHSYSSSASFRSSTNVCPIQLHHHCYYSAEQTARAYATSICLANSVEWVWPSIFSLNTGQLPEQACSDDANFLINTQVTNPFASPFQMADFVTSVPKVAPFTKKPYAEKEVKNLNS